jgi:diacylglycerol kinase (ATP)
VIDSKQAAYMYTFQNNKGFSVIKRIKSFRFAFSGIAGFFNKEHNSWLHLLATVFVLPLVLILPCNKTEIVLILLATGFVWAAELFNTAIEKLADFVTTENRPEIKFIKDVAAAAVLIAALTAFTIGCIIFIPKLF